ncbi:MAG TPA: chromate efflux transporter [Gemmatimonadales bacterium]|nr:chromate efflux transporter [Gemmatimonadales bacterium]
MREPLSAWVAYFLRLGTLGFGGPIALAAAMRRDLVERLGWIGDAEYKEGLALAQLAPGPLAAQLAIYLGWIRAGLLGATLVGLAFVGPSFVMVLLLAWGYLHYGGLPWMQAVFYGIGAAVIAIIARGAITLAARTVGRDALLWAILVVNAVVVAATERELVWIFALSGLVVPLERGQALRLGRGTVPLLLPAWWLGGLHGVAEPAVLVTLFAFFAKAALVVFGSGLAVVPFLHGGVVTGYGWLTERQFLDAVAVSMITPGPVVITVAFIGTLVAGLLGGLVAALGMFLPTWLAVVLLAPGFRRIMASPGIRAAVDGVTAAAAGAIAGAVVVLGRRALMDPATWLIALVTLVVLWRVRRVPEPLLIGAAGIVGLVLRSA